MSILFLDIETAPNIGYIWDLYTKAPINPDMITQQHQVLCAAWMFEGEQTVTWVDLACPNKKQRRHSLQLLYDAIEKADVVCGWNSKNFDEKHIRTMFLMEGMKPPLENRSLDLYHLVRRRFKFPSNKLGYVAKALGIGVKAETGGWKTWAGYMARDAEAIATMAEYNVEDVRLLARIYRRLDGWLGATTTPMGPAGTCKACGGHVISWGYTLNGKHRVRCKVCKATGIMGRVRQKTRKESSAQGPAKSSAQRKRKA